MTLIDLIRPTGVASPGMSIREALEICIEADVPGIPYQDRSRKILGKLSIRNVMKETCIPDFMVKHAHLLGDKLPHLHITKDTIDKVLALPVDEFYLPICPQATSSTPLEKALAIMEEQDTSYLFVIDDGVYKGTVSITGIARAIIANA